MTEYAVLTDQITKELADIVGKKYCLTGPAQLYAYSTDGGIHRRKPDVVVQIQNTQQASEIVKLANKYKIPITPRGAGTALCGHAVAIFGGIMADFQLMKKIKEIHVEDLYCVVEPGVIYDQLNKALAPKKYFFPPAPGSGEVCTIGGMVVANASGVGAVKYGATRDYVMGLEVVLPTGEICNFGTRTLKDSSGFQLARLMVGSEGLLGLVTEITLRVAPKPQKTASAVAAFNTLEEAGQCVSNIIATPIIPSALELMDDICIKAINKAQKMGLPECEALLLISADGHPVSVKEEIEKIAEICKKSGAISVEYTDDPKRQDDLMKARKAMIPSLSVLKPEWATVMLADDMAVPMSKVPAAVKAFHEIAARHGLLIPTYGHAGDGNLHTKFLMDPTDPTHWKHAEQATAEIYDVVLELGGTVTGEHGVSITKAPFMLKERGNAVIAMKAIKKALDPNNIFNPGKIFQHETSIITHLRYHIPTTQGALKDLPKLAKWAHEMDACTYCAYCKGVCPVFDDQGQDTGAARSKVCLAYGILTGEVSMSQEVANAFFQCTMCKDCTRRCPSAIKVPEIIEDARAELVRAGFIKPENQALIDRIKTTYNIFGDTEPLVKPQAGEQLVFVGCQFGERPNMTKMILKTLEKLNIKPKIVEERCCGFPMKVLGFAEEFEKYKEEFKNKYPYDNFTCICPTCTAFFKEEFGLNVTHALELIRKSLPENVKTKESIASGATVKVTYHDPCDFSRVCNLVEEPREMIKALGLELVEMPRNRKTSKCCGGGGGMLTSEPDMTGRIAKDRVKEAIKTGAELLLTPCATCEATLKKASQEMTNGGKAPIKVANLWDYIWKAVK